MDVSTEYGKPVLYVVAGKDDCDWVYRVALDAKGTQAVKKTKYTVVKAKTNSKKKKEKM